MARSTDWRPSSGPDAARRRADMLERVRSYFDAEKVLPVDTPALSVYPGSDPNIDSYSLREAEHLWLHTSPESSMKCLLAAGYPDIYAISRVFRGGEQGTQHLPEFTMLEWYRRNFQLADIVEDTASLIAASLNRDELTEGVRTVDYADAFLDTANIDVFSADIRELATAASADDDLRHALGDNREAWLDLVLVNVVAPTFATDQLTVLQHYPRPQAALARVCPADERVADRFEVFYGTLELANGYVELRDPAEQRSRFLQDLEQRRASGKVTAAIDEFLLAALEHGLPDCAGVALGLERLQMICDNTTDIGDVVTFTRRTRLYES